jgi:hypothetical protein
LLPRLGKYLGTADRCGEALKARAMTDKETEAKGALQMQPSGRWAVVLPGRQPVEIASGEVFLLEVRGAYPEMRRTRMEFLHHEGNSWKVIVLRPA